jgi:hypothetical protein
LEHEGHWNIKGSLLHGRFYLYPQEAIIVGLLLDFEKGRNGMLVFSSIDITRYADGRGTCTGTPRLLV